MYYPARLKAGIPFHLQAGGRVILVDTTGAADSIDITPMRGGQELRKLPNRQKAFKCSVEFDSIVISAPVDCLIGLFLSMSDVSLGFADGANVSVRGEVAITNDPNNRIPVDIGGGVITVSADNVGISNTNATAVPIKAQALSTIVDIAEKTVGAAPAAVINDPTLRRLRFRNGHATAVIALGGANVTLANSPIRLLPGDIFMEDDAAGANWFAVADMAGANLQLQGLK